MTEKIQDTQKRGRKKRKGGVENPVKLSDQYESSQFEDKIVFSSTPDEINESNLEQQQVPFGNLNITVHTSKPVDKKKLRNMFRRDGIRNINQNAGIDKLLNDTHSDYNCTIEPTPPKKKTYTKREPNIVHDILYTYRKELSNAEKWPNKIKDLLCWWCCHTFDTQPVPCPTEYDPIRDRYKIKGIFCSWECAYSYACDNRIPKYPLYRLKKNLTQNSQLKKAPPRECLKGFGGYMDIKDFRNTTNYFYISTSKMDYVNTKILEVSAPFY